MRALKSALLFSSRLISGSYLITGGAGGVAVSPSHRDREGHGFKAPNSEKKIIEQGLVSHRDFI